MGLTSEKKGKKDCIVEAPSSAQTIISYATTREVYFGIDIIGQECFLYQKPSAFKSGELLQSRWVQHAADRQVQPTVWEQGCWKYTRNSYFYLWKVGMICNSQPPFVPLEPSSPELCCWRGFTTLKSTWFLTIWVDENLNTVRLHCLCWSHLLHFHDFSNRYFLKIIPLQTTL